MDDRPEATTGKRIYQKAGDRMEKVTTGIAVNKAFGIDLTVQHRMNVNEAKDLIKDLMVRVAEVDDLTDIVALAKQLMTQP